MAPMDAPIEQRESPYEILRRMENAVRLGTIAAVRHSAPARCRVKTGNLTTGWIPWLAQRAGGKTANHWWPPAVGEQCLLLAPGGDLLQAVALPGVYSDDNAQPSADPEQFMMTWGSEGDHMRHDGSMSQLTIECLGAITLQVHSSLVEITPDFVRISAGGSTLTVGKSGVIATPDVEAMGVSLVKHLTTGVQTGSSLSGPPL